MTTAWSGAAVSGDAELLDRWSSDGFRGQVHSVFARSVNLEESDNGRLCTLACSSSDNAPATLVLDISSFTGIELSPGAPIHRAGNSLAIHGRVTISLSAAVAWAPALPPWPATDMPTRWLRDFVERHEGTGGIGRGHAAATTGPFAGRLREAVASLQCALQSGDIAEALKRGRALVGLGPGLTPSGDDYIVGLSAVCNLPGNPSRHLSPFFARLVKDNAERTNVISFTAMEHAARGRVRESISELLIAMARSDHAEMNRRGKQVVGIGATSGTDILRGVLAGLELCEDKRVRCLEY